MSISHCSPHNGAGPRAGGEFACYSKNVELTVESGVEVVSGVGRVSGGGCCWRYKTDKCMDISPCSQEMN